MDEKEFRPMRGEDKEIVMDEYSYSKSARRTP